jgi:DNA-binding winged helix-turn-helix (wHTH) protein/Tol biopolymer transport system component
MPGGETPLERQSQLGPSVRFGPFELDVRSAEICHNGRKILLHEQPFQVLLALLERPGELVSRNELVQRLWPDGTFVDYERGLNKAVNKLRDVLRDSADSPRFVETIPRRGYRFIAPLEFDGRSPCASPLPADGSAMPAASQQDSAIRAVVPKVNGRWLAAAILVLSFVAAGVYWFTKRPPPAPREVKLRQLTFDSAENAVQNGAISPDGKYLSYIDGKGIRLRLLETGETQVVPEPEALKGGKVEWEICPWFPDSTRFLVNAHPLGMQWSSQGSSIWVVSVLGGPPRELRNDAVASAISPDGSTIAFGTNNGTLGDREIWLMGVNGEKARKLYESDENSAVGGLSWFPHGQRVFYFTTDKSGDTMVTRELTGGPVTTMFSSVDMKKMQDLAMLPDDRFVYSLHEPDATNCNYWVIDFDERTGALAGKPTRLTNLGESCMDNTSVTADGKKLVFKKWKAHFQVYVADVAPSGTSISGTRRLTLTESFDVIDGWTVDSKAVIFLSNRNGHTGIFKQSLTDDTAEPLVTGSQDVSSAMPYGAWVVYQVSTKSNDPSAPVQVMRIPITGGPSELVLTAKRPGVPMCARPPSTVCVIMEYSENRKQIVVTTFDPLKGRGREILQFDLDPKDPDFFQYDISPDGTRMLWANERKGPVHILSLRGQPPQEIKVKGWSNLGDIGWAADGKALLISNGVQGGSVLLHVDLLGNAHVLWQQLGIKGTWGRQSPDGRHLAMLGWTVDSNLWMMENF